MTPEPRLFSTPRRDPKKSSGSPKKREEGIARHLPPDDLLRRDVDDGGNRPLGDAAEVGEVAGRADRSGRGDRRSAPRRRLRAGLGGIAKPAGHEQAGGEAREQDQCGSESSSHDNVPYSLGDVDAASAAVGRLRAASPSGRRRADRR